MTGAALETELQRLGTDVLVDRLNLSGNRLTCVPDLTQYKQLRQLKVLVLFANKMTKVTVENIPPSCEVLGLHGNQISDVPDLRPLTRLSRLYLNHNNIQHLPSAHLPPSLTTLWVSFNRLTDIDLSHLTNLTQLFLSDNPITTITRLPDSLTVLDAHRVRVHVLGEKCFSENTYKLLKEKLDTGALVEPPAEVFHRGLFDVRSYFEQQEKQQGRWGQLVVAVNVHDGHSTWLNEIQLEDL